MPKNDMYEEIIKKVDDNKTISFDIFDTLLLRNIHKPTDIFKILEKFAYEKYGIWDFAKLRTQAEIKARENATNGECNLNEIYENLYLLCESNIKEILALELDTEYTFITVNPFMKRIYDYAISNDKQILLISDMYLPKEFIIKLLNKCGYSGYKIFISNEYRANKGSGELYSVAEKKLCINKKEWLHIGDNTLSDFKKAIEFGINAYNYKNVSEYEKSTPKTVGEAIITGIKNNILYNGNQIDYWDEFGIKYVSPLYFGFTYWLYELTKNEDNMFFLARDGYAVKKIYDQICRLKNNSIFTEYVYCSRQSIQMPAMALQENMNDSVKLLTARNKLTEHDLTLRELLNSVKIDEKLLKNDILRIFGFKDLNDKIVPEKHHAAQKIICMLSDNIRKNLLEKRDNCLKYLKQCGMNNFDKINIMDIGWSGSIQKSLHTLLNKPIKGYYLGTLYNNDFCNMFGWAFDCGEPIENQNFIYNNVMMYELLFSAPHGSCTDYIEEDGKIKPVLNDNNAFDNIVNAFQKSAVGICEEFIKYYDYIDYINPEFCITPYDKFLSEKNITDLKHFSELSNDVAIGNSKMYPYVSIVSAKDIRKGIDFALEKQYQGIWPGAYIYDKDVSENYKILLDYTGKHHYIDEYLKFNLSHSKIYFDFGEGFSENDSVIVENKKLNDTYSFALELPLKVKAVRIDPTEHRILSMSKIRVKINSNSVDYTLSKHHKKRNNYIFENEDPNITLDFCGEMKKIEFSANIKTI